MLTPATFSPYHFFYVVWIFQDSGHGWKQVDGPIQPIQALPDTQFGYSVSLDATGKLLAGK